MQKSEVRVRFAPSPTGHMHLGSARTALYDYLFARKTGGKFILRIEDTDRNRLVPGAEEELIEGMHWLGMEWEEGPDIGGPYGPYRQSARREIYLEYAQKLIESGQAYYCFCSPERLEQIRKQKQANKELPHYDGTCRRIDPQEAENRVKNGESHVIRFKSPREGTTSIIDLLRGEIRIENYTLDDYVLVKSDGWALYHLAATVDDHLMKISHVIRGSEWLPTLPLHALIHRAFGWKEPIWVHLSVFLKPSGKGKMSKREAEELNKDGYSIFIKDLQGLGYLPEAVVNWIALMGWSFDDHTEYFTLNDLIQKFSLERLNPSPAAINFNKFDYFNRLHIRTLAPHDLALRMQPFFAVKEMKADISKLEKIATIINERITTLDDATEIANFFFTNLLNYDLRYLVIEDKTVSETIGIAERALQIISNLPELKPEITETPLQNLLEELQLLPKQLFGFLREAISAQRVTPPLLESLEILGKEEVIQRLKSTVAFMRSQK